MISNAHSYPTFIERIIASNNMSTTQQTSEFRAEIKPRVKKAAPKSIESQSFADRFLCLPQFYSESLPNGQTASTEYYLLALKRLHEAISKNSTNYKK